MSEASLTVATETQLHARPRSGCFACSPENPRGLRLRFEVQDGGAVSANWCPGSDWEGFGGIVHGGIISTVLDEAMSKAVAATKTEALTAELRVRFHHPTASGETFQIRGWIVSRKRRLIEAEASLTAPNGTEHAHAWGRFLTLPEA